MSESEWDFLSVNESECEWVSGWGTMWAQVWVATRGAVRVGVWVWVSVDWWGGVTVKASASASA